MLFADFSDVSDVCWVHEDCQVEPHIIDTHSEIYAWYARFPACDDCPSEKTCTEICDEFKRFLEEEGITKERACLEFLGRICIYSECGDIPEYVVQCLILPMMKMVW